MHTHTWTHTDRQTDRHTPPKTNTNSCFAWHSLHAGNSTRQHWWQLVEQFAIGVSCIEMWRSSIWIPWHSNLERFYQIRNSTNVLNALLSNANSWKNPCSTRLISYAQIARECRQTSFFVGFNLSYKLQYSNIWISNIVFAQWCVTLY